MMTRQINVGAGVILCWIGATAAALDVRQWAESAFVGKPTTSAPAPAGVEVRRQDHAVPQYGVSAVKTPLRIGDRTYRNGLGTHAFSQIVIRLPEPGQTFTARVGVDNNRETAGKHGSVEFIVDVAGKEAYRSGVCRGGEAARAVKVELNGARELTLRVTDGADGTPYDQADWAEAGVTLSSGKQMLLDDMPLHLAPVRFASDIPVSFTYDGKASPTFLPGWTRSTTEAESGTDRSTRVITYAEPAGGLEVTCELTRFNKYAAVEWVVRLHNRADKDTPIIESILPLDLTLAYPPKGDCILHHAHGSTCAPTDFLPRETSLPSFVDVKLAPNGGRSSDGNLPFFNLQWHGGGLVAAIGWSGQWSMRLQRPEQRELRWQMGQQTCRFKLRPGETVRTPRILLISYQGDDWLRGNNLLRQLILDAYAPRRDGQPVMPPLAANTWFTFNEGNAVTEQNQLESLRSMAELGLDAFWLDAGWFEGGWPRGAGSWVPKKDAFPRGLKPLGDAAHEAGMQFVLWFEPERVTPSSRIAREHPEWVLRTGTGDGLYNLGDPVARAALTRHLSQCIRDWAVDIYRNDFNIAPLPFWQKADEPDRQGMTEIRYVEGLYAMWDELRSQHPGLLIDNCASGGRRIDLETTTRSIPLWRSDTQGAGKPMPAQDQVQTAGLSLWVPLQTAGCWSFDPYPYRSVVTTGTSFSMDLRQPFDREQARRMLAETRQLRALQLGAFYPLLDIGLDERSWLAWQHHRADLGKGYAVFFRREKSPYAAVVVELKGLEPDARYTITDVDTGQKTTATGEQLRRLRADVDVAPGSVLLTYERETTPR